MQSKRNGGTVKHEPGEGAAPVFCRRSKKHQMEPRRSQQLLDVKTTISTGDWTGIPGIIQYRWISPPDPQVFAGLDLIAKIWPESDSVYDLTAIDTQIAARRDVRGVGAHERPAR